MALAQLREDFCNEALIDAAGEWRFSRIALLRWTTRWYILNPVGRYPGVVAGVRHGGYRR
ncbi:MULTISPECIES: hypothetical protein [Amycolatopsis]|uniref:Uncharacterized protein n=1 Tax=Amycolatopsis albidoflavus TaxID=102226 RepID=A0ABW5HSL8_9PSEU